eukprot:PITA_03060
MPTTFYDWISNVPPTSAWEESQLEVEISALDFTDSAYLTLTSSAPHKTIKIAKFFMKRDVETGLLHFEVEMSFYGSEGTSSPAERIYRLGSMPLAIWDDCNINLLHFLAFLIECTVADTYKISRVPIVDFLAHSDVLQIQDLFSSGFLAACTIAHRKENLVGMLQFPQDELDKAILGSKLDFLTAMGNDCVDQFMLMVASIFTQDYYDGNPDDQTHAVMNPFCFSKRLNSDPGSWMIRTYTPLLLMDFMGRNKESCEQTKDEWLHYALTLNHLQAVIQLRYTVEIFPDWITVEIHIHNVECDITPFSFHQYPEREKELKELGLKSERHFPSQILLSISPLLDESNILNFSRTKSCQHPGTIRYQCAQSMGIVNCGWKFYQSREKTKNIGMLEWALHDDGTGNKVVSMTEPGMDSINLNRLKRRCVWFRDRHCSSSTKKVGVGFTDDCGHSFTWRVNRDLEGQTLRWLLCGFIWLTYWPVEYDTSYCENICHELSEHIEFKLESRSNS